MSNTSLMARVLRFIGILLMALTGGFTLLGGIGTSCVAFNPKGFGESMARLAPMQWLYILFVLAGIALGVLGIRATVLLVKGRAGAYQNAVMILVGSVLVGGLHIYVSRLLRGKSMPVDAVVYTAVLTLVVFLLFRLPGIRQGTDFTKAPPADNLKAGGAAAILLGLLTLSIQFTMAPTHTWGGVNYANAFYATMTTAGSLCIILGIAILARLRLPKPRIQTLTASGSQG